MSTLRPVVWGAVSFRVRLVKARMASELRGRVVSETAVPDGDYSFTANLGGWMLMQERSLGICLQKGQGLVALAYWFEEGLPNSTPARV